MLSFTLLFHPPCNCICASWHAYLKEITRLYEFAITVDAFLKSFTRECVYSCGFFIKYVYVALLRSQKCRYIRIFGYKDPVHIYIYTFIYTDQTNHGLLPKRVRVLQVTGAQLLSNQAWNIHNLQRFFLELVPGCLYMCVHKF